MRREGIGPSGKVELMKRFMRNFVGDGFYLIIREGEKYLIVYSIGIVQKTDESCPIREVPIGGFFFQLLARDESETEVSLLYNWSQEFIQNILDNYTLAKKAGFKEIMLQKDFSSNNPNDFFVVWGEELESVIKPKVNGIEAPLKEKGQTLVSLSYIC